MSDLQLGLVAIGLIAVAAVFAYNRWQERSARRDAESSFRSEHRDVLLAAPVPRAAPARQEDPRETTIAAPLPDAGIDYVVEVAFAPAVASVVLADLWKPNEHRYAKRALVACSADGIHWRPLSAAPAAAAERLRLGLQLVARDGPVSDAELIEFRAAAETLAAAAGGSVTAPELKEVVEIARALDRFVAHADIQVVAHVVPAKDEPFPGARVVALAEAAGLRFTADGRCARYAADGAIVFSLSSRDGGQLPAEQEDARALAGLTLALDVARTADMGAAFASMLELAHQLAAALEGRLVDDNGSLLDDRALAAIGAQLERLHADFAAHGVAPGSPAALRLFA